MDDTTTGQGEKNAALNASLRGFEVIKSQLENFCPSVCVLCWYFSCCCKRFSCYCKKELKLLYYLLILTHKFNLFPWVYLVLKNKPDKVQCYIKKMPSLKKIVHKSNKLHKMKISVATGQSLFDFIIKTLFSWCHLHHIVLDKLEWMEVIWRKVGTWKAVGGWSDTMA